MFKQSHQVTIGTETRRKFRFDMIQNPTWSWRFVSPRAANGIESHHRWRVLREEGKYIDVRVFKELNITWLPN